MGTGGKRGDAAPPPVDGSFCTGDTLISTTISPGDASDASAAGRAFRNQDLVGERYRVVRFIARGGMGEVYEVEDEALGERVALKTLLGAMGDMDARERFKREILLARRVTHRNVCRIFEFGVHSDGRDADVPFLTMELLPGQTLVERIRGRGPLPINEALPLVLQLVKALSAAHAAGVIHRDFKSSNVIMVNTPAGDRPVVTDFGLARGSTTEGPSATATGLILGTPAYMAPEQAAGKPADHLADIYAMGVVLFELVTARLPFEGESALEVASMRLTTPPTAPRAFMPGLPDQWESAILKCLERDPSARFQDVKEVAAALDTEPSSVGTSTLPVKRTARSRFRRLPIIAAAALVTMVAVGAWFVWDSQGGSADDAPPRIAIMDLRVSPGSEWAAAAVREAMVVALESDGAVRVAPLEDVGTMRIDLGLATTDRFLVENTARIRDYGLADLLVVGSLTRKNEDNHYALSLALQTTATADWEALGPVEAPVGDLADIGARAAVRVRNQLGLDEAPEGMADARLALPSSPEALRSYAEGLLAWWRRDSARAKEMIGQAVSQEPDFAAGRATMLGLGGPGRTRTESMKLSSLGPVPASRTMLTDIRVARARGDMSSAERQARDAFEVNPNLEMGFELASALFNLDCQAEAEAVLERLKKLPAPEGADARIDLAECVAWFEGSASTDTEGRLGHCRAAQVAARSAGARIWLAQAQQIEGFLLATQGNLSQAALVLEEARAVLTELGMKNDLSRCLTQLSMIARNQGNGAKAQALVRDYIELTDLPLDRGWSLYTGAQIPMDLGQLDEAQRLLDQGKAVFDQLSLTDQDRTVAAAREADLLVMRGKLTEAKARYDDAVSPLNASWTGGLDRKMGILLLAMGDLKGAREKLEASRSALEQGGARIELVRTKLALARLCLEEDRVSEARLLVQAATEEADRSGMLATHARARTLEIRLALARDDIAGAREATTKEQALAEKHDFVPVRLAGLVWRARVQMRDGDLETARVDAQLVVDAATEAGLVELALKGRLALAEIDAASGNTEAARSSASALQSDSEQQGYKLLSEKAARLVTTP